MRIRSGLAAGLAAALIGATPAQGIDSAVVDAAEDVGACVIEGARVDWGFKESFRSYISGAIALGSWETSGEVDYQTPVFIFQGGSGAVAPDRSQGEVVFTGALRFRGHGGVLDTTLSDARLVALGPREAALYLDVSGETMAGVAIAEEGVDFARVVWKSGDESLDAASGVWEIRGAQVTLTEQGSGAFGTYLAGEALDPMDISLSVRPGCLEQSAGGWWWIPGGAVVAAVGGAAIWALIRRGNRSPGPERR